MLPFTKWLEAVVKFEDRYTVLVKVKDSNRVELTIPDWGVVQLKHNYSGYPDKTYYWTVWNIYGDQPGAGTVLYFAALLWVYMRADKHYAKYDLESADGWLACDSTMSPDAIRARNRMQTDYGNYIEVKPHPEPDDIKVHRGDGTDWRRKAAPEEATMWRLKEVPPFKFKFEAA